MSSPLLPTAMWKLMKQVLVVIWGVGEVGGVGLGRYFDYCSTLTKFLCHNIAFFTRSFTIQFTWLYPNLTFQILETTQKKTYISCKNKLNWYQTNLAVTLSNYTYYCIFRQQSYQSVELNIYKETYTIVFSGKTFEEVFKASDLESCSYFCVRGN